MNLLDPVDDRALVVGLKDRAFRAFLGADRLDERAELGIALLAVDLLFPNPQHVEVRPIDHQDLHRFTAPLRFSVLYHPAVFCQVSSARRSFSSARFSSRET